MFIIWFIFILFIAGFSVNGFFGELFISFAIVGTIAAAISIYRDRRDMKKTLDEIDKLPDNEKDNKQ